MFDKLSVSQLAGRMYWRLQGARRRFSGTKVDEDIWKQRSDSDVRKHLVNVQLPYRAWLVDKILAHLEVTSPGNAESGRTSVLEIGCSFGANLEVIARRAPSLQLAGIDICPASISVGNERFTELGLGHITLVEGQADDLSNFANASVDVVFTDSMLLYIGPDKIHTCIEEMRRVAKRSIILFEMHLEGTGSGGSYTRDGWVRDYRALFDEFGSDIRLVRVPPEVRPAGRWPIVGTYIEAEL